jgi:16S rRNA C967 or C1407 C5-methylase (RsmB/RsmF family)/NOL1/NOP2/fmu family ribosome biogenesis protein
LSIPQALSASLTGVKGFNKETFEAVHALGEQVTSIRLNPFKNRVTAQGVIGIQPQDVLQYLPAATPVAWCNTGYYLSERPSFTFDPLFHAGCYYVQEASSMFLEQAVKTAFSDHSVIPYRVLDLCAAPGGKSTHLSALFPEGLVVANEVIKTRSGILVENAVKWGNDNIVVTNNDAEHFKRLQGYFDMIVVDAPCSGSGMFRKDPEAITEWSLQNVDHCSKRQKRILEDVWPALKEDGVLIYCTCSYSTEEDEDILHWLNDQREIESIRIPIEKYQGIVEVNSKESLWGYRFYPDQVKGEGFFITCLRKKSAEPENIPSPKKMVQASAQEKLVISNMLNHATELSYIYANDGINVIRKGWENDIGILFSALYVKKAGIHAGKVIRNELIPVHDLSMSTIVSPAVPHIALDRETAIQYLRRGDIQFSESKKGWSLVCYNEVVLGWIKALPNRVNNYYPASFRILKG